MFADISFPISSYQVFSYKIPTRLRSKVFIGMRVMAPVRNRKAQGIIVAIKASSEFKGKIREIDSLVDKSPVLNDKLWDLITWLADYYNTPLGVVAKAALPANLSTEYEPRSQLYVKGKIGGEPLADRGGGASRRAAGGALQEVAGDPSAGG